jgi:hypothetical protein
MFGPARPRFVYLAAASADAIVWTAAWSADARSINLVHLIRRSQYSFKLDKMCEPWEPTVRIFQVPTACSADVWRSHACAASSASPSFPLLYLHFTCSLKRSVYTDDIGSHDHMSVGFPSDAILRLLPPDVEDPSLPSTSATSGDYFSICITTKPRFPYHPTSCSSSQTQQSSSRQHLS